MRFSDSFLDEIKMRLPLSQVVAHKVRWDRRKSAPARGDYWACCPFHNEKTPSFHADDRRGRYHCFGCKASGDVFKFVMDTEGLSFSQAVEQLAEEAGIALPQRSAGQDLQAKQQRSLLDIMEAAAIFFEQCLTRPDAEYARAYLKQRNVKDRAVKRFRLGFAPGARHTLKNHLAGRGYPVNMMATAGLVVTGDDIPTAFDRFRDRITFPIRDRRGRVIAFGARALDPQARAKYLNSPETPLFHKGNILYNLDQAREAAHGSGRLILVEGYMDVIALAGAGIEYAVAPLGTALTPDQLKLIWRIVPDPVLCFDGDNAGQLAAYRAVDTALPLLQPGHFLKFSFLPQGQDPDDVVNAGGKQMMDRLVESADALSQVLWQREREKSGLSTPEQRAAFEDRLQKAVEYIRDPAMRAHYRSDFKNRLFNLWRSGVDGRFGRMNRKGYKRQDGAGEPWRVGGRNRHKSAGPSPHLRHLVRSGMNRPVSEPRERLMLMMLVNYPHLVADNLDTLAGLEFESREFDRLRKAILDVIVLEKTLDRTPLRDQLCQRGFERMLKGFENRTTHRSDWFAFADAAQEDVTKAWRHIAALHMKSVTQRRALEAAQQEFAENPTEATLAYLNEVGEHIRSTAGEEAWIDGFGEASGRGGGSPFDQA